MNGVRNFSDVRRGGNVSGGGIGVEGVRDSTTFNYRDRNNI